MKYYSIFLIFFAVIVFMGFNFVSNSSFEISDDKGVHEVLENAAKTLSKKYQLNPIGTFIASPDGVVKQLGVHFQIIGPLSKEELRKLIVNSSIEFIDIVNNFDKIRPFLEVYPFNYRMLNIVYFIIDSNKLHLDDPFICTAGIRHGELFYETTTTINGMPKTKSMIYETYEEALKAVQ